MKKRITEYLKRIDQLLAVNDPATDWTVQKLEHLTQISFFMLAFMVFIAIMFAFSWGLVVLFAALLALLIPYIAHYYLLENSVQKMYEQYDRMVVLADKMKGSACARE